jgi:chemotaxis protein methyltransferase CheR
LRIWSAAASSGQEAYSLAMIVAEAAPSLSGRQVEILGTDISREQLARAREGLYSQFEVQRGLPVQSLVRHFRKEGTSWRISDALREMVSFREWNLLEDIRPLGKFDVVYCRNVLIYFDGPTKTRVLDAIAAQLAPDGLLYLGGAETVIGLTDRFVVSPGDWGVYELAKHSSASAGEPLRAAV